MFASCLGLEIDGIKFEKILTLRAMIYLDGVLSSLRVGTMLGNDQSGHNQCNRYPTSHTLG